MTGDGPLSGEELQMLERRGKETVPSIFGIDSPTEKTILEKPSRTINPASPGIDKLVAELEKIARKRGGMGIAAVQAGIPVRVVLLWRANNSGEGRFQPLINPSIVRVSAKRLDGILLSSDRPKPWFVPADRINTFAREIWRQCQSISKEECDALMQSVWEERGKALSQMTR